MLITRDTWDSSGCLAKYLANLSACREVEILDVNVVSDSQVFFSTTNLGAKVQASVSTCPFFRATAAILQVAGVVELFFSLGSLEKSERGRRVFNERIWARRLVFAVCFHVATLNTYGTFYSAGEITKCGKMGVLSDVSGKRWCWRVFRSAVLIFDEPNAFWSFKRHSIKNVYRRSATVTD